MSKEIVIVGASDIFDLTLAIYEPLKWKIIGYSGLEKIDRSEYQRYEWLGADINLIGKKFPNASFVLGLSSNSRRRELSQEVQESQCNLLSAIHPKGEIYPSAKLGKGLIIQPFSIISTQANVEDGVYINYNTLVGHDVTVGAFSFIGPGTNLLGEVCIGKEVYIGAGSTILPQVKIGDGAYIGAGAVVRRSVPPGAKVIPQSLNRVINTSSWI